jgi:polyphenol oxidase
VNRLAALPRVAAPLEWRADGALTWLTADLGPAQAAFTTRRGGVSEGPFESLNLGILTADDPDRVRQNRVTLAGALQRDPAGVAMGHQVHGAGIQVRDAVHGGELERADAQATASPQLTPLVLVADCVPLVLAARGAVVAVHCGWRGVAAGIVGGAVATVRELSGGAHVSAAIGPGIGPCCYEVGDEVIERFAARGHRVAGRALDLPAAVFSELAWSEVSDVAVAGICVSCNPELFYSHRRDGGVTGRQAGLAWLKS